MASAEAGNGVCDAVPDMVSSFVDTFVDYVVGGQFLSGHRNEPLPPVKTHRPPVERVVAIGDIHGDLGKAKEALKIGGVMNQSESWVGGSTTVVQVGDLLDRGAQELRVLYLLEKLSREARRNGGEFIVMNGNHEIMNIEGDFRYATPAACFEFQNWAHWVHQGNLIKELCDGVKRRSVYEDIPSSIPLHLRARYAALKPGGPIASRFLAHHPMVLVVGGTVFVHGGVLPSHAKYGLEKINDEVSSWILGKGGKFGPRYLHGRDAIVWARRYSETKGERCDCELLENALRAIPGSARMIVGHTIQQPFGINGACTNRVIRVDVGMSAGCGNAPPEVLEIRNDEEMKVLSSTAERDINESKRDPDLKDQVVGLAGILVGK
ncbi:hypothetical protein KP509_37G039300 [Ceratopteris richardii]|uniref:Calcineurin-like phosphoesterase domain-containing protein n=1 Tax=Ceratopteris richardii TaxID=49495 RepID=A0A8T2Q836_CERRI|nr:hypothetical protein KP509_37G039300 [Ceratopteris richardii]KAH7279836.1 hypothetical protein KP509_37G039300 [Ceratopteris richardii]